MAIDFTTIKNEAMAIINVSTATYGVHNGNPSFFDTFINDAIYDADVDVQTAIVQNPKHSQRPGYLTTVTVTDGALLPAAIGDIGPIEVTTTAGAIRTDRKVSIGDLELWKADSTHVQFGALDDVEGHFALAGDRIHFIGTLCTITIPRIVRGAASVLYAPMEYLNTVLALAVAKVLLKDPEFAFQSQTAMSVGMAGLQAIGRGELVVPELRPAMMQQAA